MARFVRMSPIKARRVVNLIRGKPVREALAILRFLPNKPARIVSKVLRSAVANATNNYDMHEDALYVARAYVDQGPVLKRWNPRARGRADIIRKPTAHVTVVVAERGEG